MDASESTGSADGARDNGQSPDNRSLFSYLTVPESDEYLAIMRVATGTLLADLSATELALAVTEAGTVIDAETVENRCRQLVAWGNLVRSVRDTRVTTISAYNRSRSRYQVSKFGGRVHRDAEEVLAAGEGAREVAREMLARIAEDLRQILTVVGAAHRFAPDPEILAGHVTSVFSGHRLFTESVTDFYAYLSGVLTRYDLAGSEYAQFKDLLIGYVDLITDDVARNSPLILDRITALLPLLDDILALLPSALDAGDLFTVERLPGRARSDWEQLAGWYAGGAGASGPDQLRSAAAQALRQLLANAKRMLAPSGTGVTRRADFLKLAGWFHTTDSDTAHRLYDAVFGAYPSRHLALGPEPGAPSGRPGDSWWDSDPVDVPVTMREHGDRAARGRASRVPDTRKVAEALLRKAALDDEARRAAAAELAAAGTLDGRTLTPMARNMLLDKLTGVFTGHAFPPDASGRTEIADTELGLTLTLVRDPSARTVINASDGILTVDGCHLAVTPQQVAGGTRATSAKEESA